MKKAQSLIEYILILVMISMIAIATLQFLGKRMSFGEKDTQINQEQNIVNTMTNYCKTKGLTYDIEKEECE